MHATPADAAVLPRRVRRRLYAHGGGPAGAQAVAIDRQLAARAGRLIGRGGATVWAIEAESGARVRRLPASCRCLLAGSPVARSRAQELVAEALARRGRPRTRRPQRSAHAGEAAAAAAAAAKDDCKGRREAHVARQARLRLKDAVRRAGWPRAVVHLLPGARAALMRKTSGCQRPGRPRPGRPNGRLCVRGPDSDGEVRLLALEGMRLADAAGVGEEEEL